MRITTYQPHIDGLRAVAVLLVIFHHLGEWSGLPGGFVGVDVFFVISGFLITSIIRSEIAAGRFSLGGFYKRRVLRLAPAYFTMLAAVTVAALIWMLPAELISYSRSVIASGLFLANFHMWKEVGGYFGVSADAVPLLHLWTLSVEEQFYLLWPLSLVALSLFPRRWIPRLLIALVIIGVAASQWGASRYPAAAYYLLPTRFFELATGAALAYLPKPSGGRQWRNVIVAVGISMVLYASVSYWKETVFPGYAAVLPVIGTAAVLRWGEGTAVGWALSTGTATLIGKISYPAYLWHWPIIAFLHLNEVAITPWFGVGLAAATLALAWMTYHFVELPARRWACLPARRVILVGAGIPVAASVSLGMAVVMANGLPSRFPESLNLKSEALLSAPDRIRGRCNEGPPSRPLPPDDCILGRTEGKVEFLLVGDSHANHFTGFFDVLARDAGLRGYDMTRSQTAFLPGAKLWVERDGSLVPHRSFAVRNDYVTRLLQNQHFDTIVLIGNYPAYYNAPLRSGDLEGRPAFEDAMRRAIREALSASSRVVVVESVPTLHDGLNDCPLRVERFGVSLDCTLPVAAHRRKVKDVHEFFSRLGEEFPSVMWLDPGDLLCDERVCVAEIDGVPLYKDRGHLNDMGARQMARTWLARYGNPLQPSSPQRSRKNRPVSGTQ